MPWRGKASGVVSALGASPRRRCSLVARATKASVLLLAEILLTRCQPASGHCRLPTRVTLPRCGGGWSLVGHASISFQAACKRGLLFYFPPVTLKAGPRFREARRLSLSLSLSQLTGKSCVGARRNSASRRRRLRARIAELQSSQGSRQGCGSGVTVPSVQPSGLLQFACLVLFVFFLGIRETWLKWRFS